jgi:hypothetical protein
VQADAKEKIMESFWCPSVFQTKEPHPAQLRFEAKRVEMVLRKFKLTKVIPELIQDDYDYWGVKRLNFESFHRRFPTFPFMMEGQSFYRTSEQRSVSLKGLFLAFHKSFIYKRYMVLLERYRAFSSPKGAAFVQVVPKESRGLPLAMPFPFVGIRGGLVLHNCDQALTTGFHLYYEYYNEKKVQRSLWVEGFLGWLDAVAKLGWTPESPPPTKLRRRRPVVHRGAIIRPWMVRICGGFGPETYLLGIFLRFLRPGANKYERSCRIYRMDNVWLFCTIDALARATGLSKDQVKRALRKLRKLMFIETRRGVRDDGKVGICVRLLRSNIRDRRAELG